MMLTKEEIQLQRAVAAQNDNLTGVKVCDMAEAHRQAQEDGMVLVQREATEAMICAGVARDNADVYSDIGADVASIYRAMLAARPQPRTAQEKA